MCVLMLPTAAACFWATKVFSSDPDLHLSLLSLNVGWVGEVGDMPMSMVVVAALCSIVEKSGEVFVW